MAIIKYKSGGSWISIPIYVNTGGEVLDYVTRSELESMGYISELKTINNQSLIGSGNINIAVDLSGYYTKTEVDNLIPSLDNYYDKTETYSQSEVNALLDSAGNIDLTNYYTKTETYSQSEVNSLIDNINAGSVDLTNYYTKTEVDNLIPNDYLTSSSLSGYATQSWVNNQDFASSSDIPTSVSELTNDVGYLTSIPSSYVTETELSSTLSDYVKASDVIAGEGAIKINYSEIENYMSREITEDGKLYFSLSDTSAYSSVINEAIVTTKQTVIISTTPSDYNRAYVDLVINPTSNYYNYHYTCEINGLIGVGISLFNVHGRVHVMPVDSNMIGLLFYVPKDCYSPVDIHYLTYSELKTLADNYGLVAGRKYGITDYSCIYTQPVSNVEMEVSADDIEAIICTAVTEETLSENVEIVRSEGYVPIIECKYDIDPESCSWTAGMTTLSPKGVIWYMKDANGNECNYDFKHVKFRRWAITDITANMDTDNGSGGSAGPFCVNMTSSSYDWEDDRNRVGSGDSVDATMIPNIFNGTWSTCTTDLSTSNGESIEAFHSDYSLQCHKPYQNTSYANDKYLAWTTDMRSSEGMSQGRSESTCTVYGMADVEVDSSDYIDRYTFDYEGSDASELTRYNDTEALIIDAKIGGWGLTKNNRELSNTCFIISANARNNASTYIMNVNLWGAYNNTFLLRNYGTLSYSEIINLKCNSAFDKNLIITNYWYDVLFDGITRWNYLCADFKSFKSNWLCIRNVIFGYVLSFTSEGIFSLNLWYNVFQRIKLSSGSSWITLSASKHDAMSTNNLMCHGFFVSNILAPCLYSRFWPHINTNTFRCVYNKGFEMRSSNMRCSFGLIAYDTVLGYNIGWGLKFGNIIRSYIPGGSFVPLEGGSVRSLFSDSQTSVPSLYNVDVSSYKGDSSYFSTLSSSNKSLLSDSTQGVTRKVLYIDGTSWNVKYAY